MSFEREAGLKNLPGYKCSKCDDIMGLTRPIAYFPGMCACFYEPNGYICSTFAFADNTKPIVLASSRAYYQPQLPEFTSFAQLTWYNEFESALHLQDLTQHLLVRPMIHVNDFFRPIGL